MSHEQFDDFSFGKHIFFSHSPFQSVIFLSLIHSCLVIISMEMPQLGQLAILMAVITPCFPSMSLIQLTVFFPLCCNPSILIKTEWNDQQWLGAGAHPSQHMAEEKPPVAFIYGLTPWNLPEHAFSLWSMQTRSLKLKSMFIDARPFHWYLIHSKSWAAYIWMQQTDYWRSSY